MEVFEGYERFFANIHTFLYTKLKTIIFTFAILSQSFLPILAQTYGAKEYFQRGEIELYLGDHKQAIEQYNLAIRQKQDYADAYFSRGRAYMRLQDLPKAAQDFYQTIRLQPQKAEAYFYLGAVFQENGEIEQAMDYYSRAIEIDAKLPLAYNYRAEIYRKQGLTALALEDYHQAIKYGGRQAPLYFGRGKCFLSLQKAQEAVADFSQAIEIEPRQILYYQYRLEANFILNNYPKTIQDIQYISQIQGDSIEPTYKSLLVFCYLQEKDWQKALQAMENLPAEQKNTPKFYADRGNCYFALQKTEKALENYQKLLALAPDSLVYHKKCITLYWAGKAHEKVVQEATQYLKNKPQDAEVWYWKGFSQFSLGKKKECKPDLEMAQMLGYKREDMDLTVQPLVKKRRKK